MEEVRHKTAASWMAAMDTGHLLLQGDDPKRRLVGFFDHTDEKHHVITFANARTTGGGLSPSQRDLIGTSEGRKKIIEGY